MKNGFINIGCATIEIKVADVEHNIEKIKEQVRIASQKDVQLLIFHELSITGATCGDLFYQDALIKNALNGLIDLKNFSIDYDIVFAVGLPLKVKSKLLDVAAVIYKGKILGIIPKEYLNNTQSQFTSINDYYSKINTVKVDGQRVSFGQRIIFTCEELPDFSFAVELGEDLYSVFAPSVNHSVNGATIIINLAADNEEVTKDEYRRKIIVGHTLKTKSIYALCSAGNGESTTDLVFAGHNIVAENGEILNESKLFENSLLITQVDVNKITNERIKNESLDDLGYDDYKVEYFNMSLKKNKITRDIKKLPFIPLSKEDLYKRCEEILIIQAYGLKKRIEHTNSKKLIVGISGGLDSCLALLVMVRTMDLLKLNHQDIIAVAMPCFGTSSRTYNNALALCNLLDVRLLNIPIADAINQHFKDIEHDVSNHDVTYENSQARERTQILMDIANKYNGLVVGTGDLSELALGFATYNGDHMSMYGVNASVPKTLVRYLVKHEAKRYGGELGRVLIDVFETPVSPELLPPVKDKITQVTEDIVGPYELHDFFLYYIVRWGFTPAKVFDLACFAFDGVYDGATIKKWLSMFVKRFFSQQFKRSCLPDGPKVGSVSLSPRGGYSMPSDAISKLWIKEIENL